MPKSQYNGPIVCVTRGRGHSRIARNQQKSKGRGEADPHREHKRKKRAAEIQTNRYLTNCFPPNIPKNVQNSTIIHIRPSIKYNNYPPVPY